jgi:hypothetical protein
LPQPNNSVATSASSSSSKLPDAKVQAQAVPKTPPLPKPVAAAATDAWQSVDVAAAPKNRNRVAGYSPTTSKSKAIQNNNFPNKLPMGWTAPAIRTTPGPGSWATRLHNSSSDPARVSAVPQHVAANRSATNTTRNTTRYDDNSNSQMPPSPSSDWRTHASPRIQRAIQRGGKSPSSGESDHGGTTNGWPSLKEFPAVPSLKPGGKSNGLESKQPIPISAPPTKKPLQGAWGSRS